MERLLRKLDTLLRSTPCALLTYFTPQGEARLRAVEWVGIVCSEPALLTVCLKRTGGGEGLEGREFVVNLPGSAQLADLTLMEEADLQASTICAHPAPPGRAATVSAPLLPDAPIRLECRKGSARRRFDRDVISAQISALHIAERIYGREAPPDLYRLAPFDHPLIISRAADHTLQNTWSARSGMENSTCF